MWQPDRREYNRIWLIDKRQKHNVYCWKQPTRGSKERDAEALCDHGYIAARADWIMGLVDLQVATCFGGPSPVATELITNVLAGGGYRKHMDEVRERLKRARKEAVDRLASLGLVPWIIPRGGFYLWCSLHDGHDSADIARRCMEQKVVLAPGNVFSVSQSATSFLRFNVAQLTDKQVFVAIQHAMEHGK